MLKSVVSKLLCPTCLDRKNDLVTHTFTERADGHVKNGVLVCRSCQAAYPIIDDLLEFVRFPLLDQAALKQFEARFRMELTKASVSWDKAGKAAGAGTPEAFAAQLKQREYFDSFAEDASHDYNAYHNTPFWTAVDALNLGKWRNFLKNGTWMLDVGCADGRSTFPMLKAGTVAVGFDISKNMIRKAIRRAQNEKVSHLTTFMVADGSFLPFKDQSFEYALVYGVLHHLPNPSETCHEVFRILKDDGIYFGCENNKTVFRGVFDRLMKWIPLWEEEAGEEPLISTSMFEDWFRSLPVRVQCETKVFALPT